MKVRSNNDHRDEHRTTDHTEDILEWAKGRICAVSESRPFRMAPMDHSMVDPEPEPPAPKTEPKRVEPSSETAPKTVEPPEVSTLKMASRLLVVELDEANANQGKVHFLPDDREAGRFIESLLDKGLAPDRLAALRGTRMSMNVRYRVSVSIEHPSHE
ncbi:MAG: hypothetical protein JSU97_10075 [Dehalococcoidia bacterium]|nr:MAG: hypothetical protein JSU97_10075 [Dehalococcoidia bacterium]